MSDVTLLTEALLPVLILSPVVSRAAMNSAIFILIPFHLAMVLTIKLGIFSLAMIGLGISFYRSADDRVRITRDQPHVRYANVAGLLLISFLAVEVYNEVVSPRKQVLVVDWPGRSALHRMTGYTQRWSMFTADHQEVWADIVPTASLIVALKQSGQEVFLDPNSGQPIDWAQALQTRQKRGSALEKFSITSPRMASSGMQMPDELARQTVQSWYVRIAWHYARRSPVAVDEVYFFRASLSIPRTFTKYPSHYIKTDQASVTLHNNVPVAITFAERPNPEVVKLPKPWFSN